MTERTSIVQGGVCCGPHELYCVWPQNLDSHHDMAPIMHCHVMHCHVLRCHVMQCHQVCYGMQCYAMKCYVKLTTVQNLLCRYSTDLPSSGHVPHHPTWTETSQTLVCTMGMWTICRVVFYFSAASSLSSSRVEGKCDVLSKR